MIALVVEPVGGGVEIIFWDVEIEIRFAGPRDEVSGLAQVGCEGGWRVEEFRTHVMRADGGGVAAGDEAGAAGGANGGVSESAGEARAFAREFVDVRRAGVGVAVTAEFGPEIFADDEDEVGTIGGNEREEKRADQNRD